MPGMLLVLQILGQLFVGELAAEPGVPPEQERHQHDQPRGQEEKQPVTRGHARTGLG